MTIDCSTTTSPSGKMQETNAICVSNKKYTYITFGCVINSCHLLVRSKNVNLYSISFGTIIVCRICEVIHCTCPANDYSSQIVGNISYLHLRSSVVWKRIRCDHTQVEVANKCSLKPHIVLELRIEVQKRGSITFKNNSSAYNHRVV